MVVNYLQIFAEILLAIVLIVVFSADVYMKDMFKSDIFSRSQIKKLFGYGWALFPLFILHQAIYGGISVYNEVTYLLQ